MDPSQLEPQRCKTREILSGSRSREKIGPYEERQGKGDEGNEMNERKKIEDRMCDITLLYEGLVTINYVLENHHHTLIPH